MAERRTTAHTQDIRKRRPMCSKMLMSRKNKTAHRFSRYRHKNNKSPYTSKQRYTHKHSYRKKNKKKRFGGGQRQDSIYELFTIVGHLDMYSIANINIKTVTFSNIHMFCNKEKPLIDYLPSYVRQKVETDINKFKNSTNGTKNKRSLIKRMTDTFTSTNNNLSIQESLDLWSFLCKLRDDVKERAMDTLMTESDFFRDLDFLYANRKKNDLEKNILMMLCLCFYKESHNVSENNQGQGFSSDVRNYTTLLKKCQQIRQQHHLAFESSSFNRLKTMAFSADKYEMLGDAFQKMCAAKLINTKSLETLCDSTIKHLQKMISKFDKKTDSSRNAQQTECVDEYTNEQTLTTMKKREMEIKSEMEKNRKWKK